MTLGHSSRWMTPSIAPRAGRGKTYAWSVIESLKSQMDRVRQLSTWKFPMARLIRQHEAVVAAIAAGDRAAAEAAMREHLRAILTDLPLIREEFARVFRRVN